MELPHLGQNCIVCNRNDYLPFKCSYCDKIICIDHKTNHGDDCPVNRTQFRHDPSQQSESLRQACDFCKKITSKLELTQCQQCLSSHCLYHRHQAQHNCRLLVEFKEAHRKDVEEKNEKRNEALNKLKGTLQAKAAVKSGHSVENSPAKPPYLIDTKKRELARRIQLMKIKMTARGPPNILTEDKKYFEVKFKHNPESSLSDQAKDDRSVKIFTTDQHTIGRMLDWSADELDLKNRNHLADADQLVFKLEQSETDELVELDSQVKFSFYLEKKILFEGDILTMTYKCKN